jgi:hypothetical protein
MSIHRADMRNTAFTIGSYNPGTSGVAGPALREPATGNPVQLSAQENEHFYTNTATYSYTLNPTRPSMNTVSFGPPNASGHRNCYYLPFIANNITSVKIGTAAHTFFTDNLSGCSIFIDRAPDGDLVVHHANRQGMAYTGTAEQRLDAKFERQVAVAVKHVQHDGAVRQRYPGAVNLTSLFKARYMVNAARAENTARFAGVATNMYGTTVVGFHRAGAWLFWYQTWMTPDAGLTYQVLQAEQFYP